MAQWVKVASIGQFDTVNVIGVIAGGQQIAIYKTDDGAYYATHDVCTHAYALLSQGYLEGCLIECPLHAGYFDVRTGKAQGNPVTQDIRSFPLKVEGDTILVETD